MLGGGMLSRTGGQEKTLSARKKDSQEQMDEQLAQPRQDNLEDQQLTASAADSRLPFGHRQSDKTLERESNVPPTGTPTRRPGLNNIKATSKNELYDAIEEESNAGRDTAEKNKARSSAPSPAKDEEKIAPEKEKNAAAQPPPQRRGLDESDHSPADEKALSQLLKQKAEHQSALTKHPPVSDRHGSKLQQMNQTPLGTLVGHKSQNKTPANPTPNTKQGDMSNMR